ncbi:MAG: HAD family hydrolase [Casimicrobiaceae bacterium]
MASPDDQRIAPRSSWRPALFLDRDGVINIDSGYVHTTDAFVFLTGIHDLCRRFQARNYRIVVVTNQAGIGRGLYSQAEFDALTAWMIERFADEGVRIDGVYACPYHPEHGRGDFLRDSFDRKPNPGMLLKARDDLGLDLDRSVLVGDRMSDIEAALRAGVARPILLCSDGVVPTGLPAGLEIARALEAIHPEPRLAGA